MGLGQLVEYNRKKVFDVKLKELKTSLTDQIAEDVAMNEVIDSMKLRCKDSSLPDVDVVRMVWAALMDAIQWSEEPTTEYQLGVATGVWNLQFWPFLLFKTNLIGVSFPNIYYLHSIFVSNIVGKLL